MTRNQEKVEPSEIKRLFAAVENEMAEARTWRDGRRETGLSPLATKLRDLGDEYSNEFDDEPRYRYTWGALLHFALYEASDDPSDVETPAVPNEAVASILDDLQDVHPAKLVGAFEELYPPETRGSES